MNNITNFKHRITLVILRNVAFISVGYIAILSIIYFTASYICSKKIWYPANPTYQLLVKLRNNKIEISLAFMLIGLLIIFIYNIRILLGYLEDVTQATSNIFYNDNKLLKMPPLLNDVEAQLNQIKLNYHENMRIAKEAEQRKNDLVVYLAHDLKTPLTSVIGYLTLLHDEHQISDELRDKYLSISLQKAERLEDLINEFFEITRFNLSNITLEYSSINFTLMIEQLAFEFKPMFLQKNLDYKLTVPPNLNIKCDVDKMQRVLDNILRNAVNYSFENTTIEIEVIGLENTIELTVTNHGNTIPEEKLNRIFEQFYRLDTARATKTGGAGLGLAIAKEIVELHHGSITASSSDETITFCLILPTL